MNLIAKLWELVRPAIVQPDPTPPFAQSNIRLARGWRLDLLDICHPHCGTFRARVLVGPRWVQPFTTRHEFVVPPSRN